MSSSDRTAEWLLCVLKRLGSPITKGTRVLEIGCGNGDLVHAFRTRGIDAVGCDLQFKTGPRVEELRAADLLRVIERNPYRLPFENASFDVIVSVSVLEHVMNLRPTLQEIARVTRAGGEGLHMFPARYRPIEPHTYVPLATLLRTHWWLRLWSALGVRNSYQAGMNSAEVAAANFKYLHGSTNYLSRWRIIDEFQREFTAVKFCEDLFVSCGTGAASNRIGLGKLMVRSPLLTRLYSAARSRIVWVRR